MIKFVFDSHRLSVLANSFIKSSAEQLKKMFHTLVLFCLCGWSLIGVFGDQINGIQSVSVMEGDSVLLHTDVTEIHEDDDIEWKFRDKNSLITKNQIFPTSDVPDGRFRDRLKLDDQTGSLTITNTTTEHTGVYQLEITGVKLTSKTFNVSVYARLPVPVIIRDCTSSSSSTNCSLVCSSVLNVSDVTLSWYAGMSVLSSISVCDLSISLSLPLEVEYQGKNTYSCVLNNPISNQTTHLDINTLCHTCAVSLIVLISAAAAAGSLMIISTVVIFNICRRRRKTDQEVQTREEEITYAVPTFHKRKAHKLNVKEKDHVEYAPIAMT
ncbi:SLAM family member 9-like [Siphateles boraxobius]|uniref:SLAM family member 9-like n=1 Tax=Siphateles boraxobius TaxID=180520 RepID=UPI004063AF98